jgi:hypothetical protein
MRSTCAGTMGTKPRNRNSTMISFKAVDFIRKCL